MKRFMITAFFTAAMLFQKVEVWAFSSGFSSSDVGYDLYDLVVNKGLDGPIGWVIVAVLVIMGFVQLAKGAATPAIMAIGAGIMIKATPNLLTTFGMTLNEMLFISQAQLMPHVGTLVW